MNKLDGTDEIHLDKIDFEKLAANFKYAKAVWNAALERAADEIEYCNPKEAEEIRKLKK